jgi:hypothetical protein
MTTLFTDELERPYQESRMTLEDWIWGAVIVVGTIAILIGLIVLSK